MNQPSSHSTLINAHATSNKQLTQYIKTAIKRADKELDKLEQEIAELEQVA